MPTDRVSVLTETLNARSTGSGFHLLTLTEGNSPTVGGIAFARNADANDQILGAIEPNRIVMLSEHLNDEDFQVFVEVLHQFLVAIAAQMRGGLSYEDAVLPAQEEVAEADPERYAVLASVFEV